MAAVSAFETLIAEKLLPRERADRYLGFFAALIAAHLFVRARDRRRRAAEIIACALRAFLGEGSVFIVCSVSLRRA